MRCTYENCDQEGVGKATDTATHWLCDEHLKALAKARDEYSSTGDKVAMKRLIGHTISAMGGAKAVTEKMKPTIEAGAKFLAAVAALKEKK